MSKAPSMPVFVDALVGDTLDLSPEEFGAYCLILFTTWRNNGVPLPDDDKRMARICRITEKRWRERIRPALARFFDISGGAWRQGRLEKEWIFVAKQVEQKRAAGIASHKAKLLKQKKTDPTAVAEPLQRQGQQPTPTPTEEDSVVANAPTAEGAPEQHVAVVVVGEPPEPQPARDYVKETFDMSVEIFGPKGRALVGKALKNTKDSFIVLDALYATRRECVGDPVEFFMGAIKWRMGNGRQSAHAAETAAFDAITRH